MCCDSPTTPTSPYPSPFPTREAVSLARVCAALILLSLCGPIGCGSFDLFYVDVAVVPVAVMQPDGQEMMPRGIPAQAIRDFLTLYPLKKGRLAAIEANKANGGLVAYRKTWGIFRINRRSTSNAESIRQVREERWAGTDGQAEEGQVPTRVLSEGRRTIGIRRSQDNEEAARTPKVKPEESEEEMKNGPLHGTQGT